MTNYFVTRHTGAIEWALHRGIDAVSVLHLDPGQVKAGDAVQGILPIHLVAEINRKGVRYLHLEMEMSQDARGQELSADDLERMGAKLVEYRAERIGKEF